MLTRSGELTPRDKSVLGNGLFLTLFSSRASILHGLMQRNRELRAGYQHEIRKSMIGAHAAKHAFAHPAFTEVMRDHGLQGEMARVLEHSPAATFEQLYHSAKTRRLT